MKVALSRDEMLSFYECLLKRKKGGTHDFILSESEDWKKNPCRLVLKDSKWGGLVLHHMNAEKPLDEVAADVPEGTEDDSEMVTAESSTPDDVVMDWVESWSKFYISKNEDWAHVAKVIKYFLADVNHEMQVDAESVLPPTPPLPPAPPVTPSSTMSSPFGVVEVQKLMGDNPSLNGKTKGKTGEEKKKKRKRPTIDSDGEVCPQEVKKLF